MNNLSKEAITLPRSDNEIFTDLAKHIRENKLSAPAVFVLEMYKPLSNVLYNLGLVSLPLLLPLLGMQHYQRALRLLDSPDNIEKLIQAIECQNSSIEEGTLDKV